MLHVERLTSLGKLRLCLRGGRTKCIASVIRQCMCCVISRTHLRSRVFKRRIHVRSHGLDACAAQNPKTLVKGCKDWRLRSLAL